MRRCPSLARALALPLVLASLVPVRSALADAPPESLEAFRGDVAAARAIAHACAQDKSACTATRLPLPTRVAGTGSPFFMRWTFMEEALRRAPDASDADRRRSMDALGRQLDTVLAEAGGTAPVDSSNLARGRQEANHILARPEFQSADGPGWLDRQLAHLQEGLLHLFTGMDRLGQRAPWLAPLLEWTCFALAAAGLLWYVRQSLRRQSLQLSLEGKLPPAGDRGRDTATWQRLARESAAEAQWREAIHCLFWAAIALLEERRAWRPNPTRTPREYTRLLRPGSSAQAALRELTHLLEQSWYGATPASEAAFQRAQQCVSTLTTARDRPVRDPDTLSTTQRSPA